jgi:hypothetical protein
MLEIGVDPAVAPLVRIGEGAPGDPAPQARMVELGLQGAEAGLDVAQALPVRELGEGEAEELVVAGECPDLEARTLTPLEMWCNINSLADARA